MKPLYALIVDYIKNEIRSGRLKPGDKVPSENELARKFNVNRLTARKALEVLEYEGLVTRIQGLGTFVSSLQNSLRGKKVGVLITNYQDTRGSLLFGVVKTLQNFAINAVPVFDIGTAPLHEEKLIRELLKVGISGLIIEPRLSSISDNLLVALIKDGFPVVFVDRMIEGFPRVPVVHSDNRNGGKLIGKHMKKHGVKRVLFVTEESTEVSSVKERLEGVKEEVDEVIEKIILDYDDDFLDILKIVKKEKVQAIFFCNDYLAVRGIGFLKENGMKVPKNVGVYGFDNLRVSVYCYPRLTTVNQDFQAMGELAALLLVKILLNEPWTFEERVPVKLVVRESCGCETK
jgi:DNA-binding LacI/PurR family transcriptional regulator